MKKFLVFLTFILLFSISNSNLAEAAIRGDSTTKYFGANAGLAAYFFNYSLHYQEEYHYNPGWGYSIPRRSVYVHIDRLTPSLAGLSTKTEIYNGSTLLSIVSSFSEYYPDRIVPTKTQNRDFQSLETKVVNENTGKTKNTTSIIISCSTYIPCIFAQDITFSY